MAIVSRTVSFRFPFELEEKISILIKNGKYEDYTSAFKDLLVKGLRYDEGADSSPEYFSLLISQELKVLENLVRKRNEAISRTESARLSKELDDRSVEELREFLELVGS